MIVILKVQYSQWLQERKDQWVPKGLEAMAQRGLLRYGRLTLIPILRQDILSWTHQWKWKDLLSSHTTNIPVQRTLRLTNLQYPRALQHLEPTEAYPPTLKCHKRPGPLRCLQKRRRRIHRTRCIQPSLLHTKRNNLRSRWANPQHPLHLNHQGPYQSKRTKWSISPQDKFLLSNSLRLPPRK